MMDKKRRFFIICFICGLLVSALEKVDSVKTLHKQLPLLKGKERIMVLNEIADQVREKDPQQALRFAREALTLAEQERFPWEEVEARSQVVQALMALQKDSQALPLLEKNNKRLAELANDKTTGILKENIHKHRIASLNLTGLVQMHLQKSKESFNTYCQALELQKQAGAEIDPDLLRNIGQVAIYLADYDTALSYLLSGLEAAERLGKNRITVECSYLVGYVHRDLNNYSQSRQYFQKALELAQVIGDTYHTILALNELGNVCLMEDKSAKALPFKERALALARKYANRYVLSSCLHDMGVYHSYIGNSAKALPFFQEALGIDRLIGNKRDIIISLTNITNCNSNLGRYSEAIAAAKLALNTASEEELPKDILMVYDQEASVYEKMGDFRQALVYKKKYEVLNQKIFNQEKMRQIAEMQERFESVKRQKENELLRHENQIKILALEKQTNLRNYLLVLALLVLLMAGLIYSRYRDKSKANIRLESANLEIRSQQKKLEEAYLKMEILAREDTLTGLPNRRIALEELDRETRRHERHGHPFVILMGDLNGFKGVNDTFGHDAGDVVLKTISALLRQTLRKQDTLARWGGDEFFFLLPETDQPGARIICKVLKEKVRRQKFEFQGRKLTISLSLGLSQFNAGKTVDQCLKEADQEMYRQKNNF